MPVTPINADVEETVADAAMRTGHDDARDQRPGTSLPAALTTAAGAAARARTGAAGPPISPAQLIALQRTVGNRAAGQLLPVVQRKPTAADVLGNLAGPRDVPDGKGGSTFDHKYEKDDSRLTEMALTGPIDWFDRKVFREATRTRGHQRSTAQVAIDRYLEKLATARKTGATEAALREQEQLLLQMKYAAEGWIVDHAVEDDGDSYVRTKSAADPTSKKHRPRAGGYIVDPKRKKRFAGMSAFLTAVDAELVMVRDALKDDHTAPPADLDEAAAGKRHKKLKAKYEGDPTTTLGWVGRLIDFAVPKPGDSSELEIAFRFPVDESGTAFVGGTMRAKAENYSAHDPTKDKASGAVTKSGKLVKTRTELVFTVGAQWVDLARVQAELGGYMEIQAQNGEAAMTLVSYMLYRRAIESFVMPRAITDYMWGGRKGRFGAIKADKWSRDVEKRLLSDDDENEDNYVETGLTAGVSGKFGKKVGAGLDLEVGGGVSFDYGTRYDPKSIADVKGSRGGAGASNKRHDKANLSAAQERLGRQVMRLGTKFELSVGPFAGSIEVTFKWASEKGLGSGSVTRRGKGNSFKLTGLQIEFSAGASFPAVGGDELVERIGGWVVEGLKLLVDKVRAGVMAKKDSMNAALAKQGGTDKAGLGVGETTTAAMSGLEQLGNVSAISDFFNPGGEVAQTSSFAEALGGSTLESSIGVSLTMLGDPVADPKTFYIGVSMDKERAFSVPLFLDVTQSSSTRLIAFEWSGDDGWSMT